MFRSNRKATSGHLVAKGRGVVAVSPCGLRLFRAAPPARSDCVASDRRGARAACKAIRLGTRGAACPISKPAAHGRAWSLIHRHCGILGSFPRAAYAQGFGGWATQSAKLRRRRKAESSYFAKNWARWRLFPTWWLPRVTRDRSGIGCRRSRFRNAP